MTLKLTNIYQLMAAFIVAVAFAACTETPTYETCGGQPSCPPPTDEKSSESLKKLRQEIAGKWKFASLDTRDTIHKTSRIYNTEKASLCISYDGGIQFFRNYTDLLCTYCYELTSSGDTLKVKIDESGLSKYCKEQLQSSTITIRNDSMILFRRDSFIVKNVIYKRMNEDGSFKTQN